MRLGQSLALWLIAGVLGTDLFLNHAVPGLSLAFQRSAYTEASRACHEARSYLQQVTALANEVDDGVRSPLLRSAAVSMLDCQSYQIMRNGLLAAGVKEHSLHALDIAALRASRTALPYTVEAIDQ